MMYSLSVALGRRVYKIQTKHTLSHNRKLYFHYANKPWKLKSLNSYLPCLKTKLKIETQQLMDKGWKFYKFFLYTMHFWHTKLLALANKFKYP